jgi:hypothetical protein
MMVIPYISKLEKKASQWIKSYDRITQTLRQM